MVTGILLVLTGLLAALGGFVAAGWVGSGVKFAVAYLAGLRAITLNVGLGPAVWARAYRRGSVVVRALPLWLSGSLVLVREPRVRLRSWLASLAAVLAMGGLAVATSRLPGAWAVGAPAGVLAGLAVTSWPFVANPVGSHGAVLLRLPFLPEAELRPMLADPRLVDLFGALGAYDLPAAEKLLEPLAGEPLELYGRVGLLQARGQYLDAVRVAMRMVTDPEISTDERWGAVTPPLRFECLAGALLLAGEAGHLPEEQWRPAVGGALAQAAQLGCPQRLLEPDAALFAALTGSPAEAKALGYKVLATAASPAGLAGAYCTLALAHAGLGDHRVAGRYLRRARRLMPPLPRIAHVELRLRAPAAA